ncbi:uncharacterized protein LOC129189347 [Dunckerocampus dactyliophorus]|uniref:uncharacterized protein LOC129189347 n=1 Tax=Dunckerocampus dactyliophorus TaxID=161453 RepID=UPI0024059FF4|nr:uncharacterized protein LOC129189347 [Dunckerocampus dactyliophorus]
MSEDTRAGTESDFEKTLALIGGRERIYLVSDACQSKEAGESDAGVLQEFIRDLFHGGNDGQPISSSAVSEQSHVCTAKSGGNTPLEKREDLGANTRGKTARREVSSSSLRRTIDYPSIVFLFRQTFISCDHNQACLKEILKDVKARTKRAGSATPALIGLVRTTAESTETQRCVQHLDRLIRNVFPKHAPETIWVGSFVPSAESSTLNIKRNFCRVISSSPPTADITSNSGNPLLWPFQCLFRPNGGGTPNSSPTSKQRGDSGSMEESIPLKSNSTSAGPNEESAGGNC